MHNHGSRRNECKEAEASNGGQKCPRWRHRERSRSSSSGHLETHSSVQAHQRKRMDSERCSAWEHYRKVSPILSAIDLLQQEPSAQSHELRTSMAGQIARALSVFCVDEVIIFSDGNATGYPHKRHHNRSHSYSHHTDPSEDEYTGTSDPDHFLVHLLSYLETPPHLRKHLFPLHPNLRTAGTLPSLDLPHHLRADEWCQFREGVALEAQRGQDKSTTMVEVGLRIPITVDAEIPANTRVTLKIADAGSNNPTSAEVRAEAVNPDEPREESGYYWGFNVRRAACLSDVFTECTYDGGYDVTVGTSERGSPLETLYSDSDDQKVDKFSHLLVVFGGVAGLEVAVKNDPELQKLKVTEAKDVFDRWIDICPGQGSRTIRTEEAVWIGLMGLRRLVVRNEME